MKKLKHGLAILLSMAGMGFVSTVSATLISRPGGMVYDTDRNITWLADANLAASNTFGVGGINTNGTMSWYTAQSWVAAMDAANYLGYNNWRLPTTLQLDASCGYQLVLLSYGWNCTGSELGHLFYGDINHGLGGVADLTIASHHNANYGLFSNIISSDRVDVYWSGTDNMQSPNLNGAWWFSANNGFEATAYKGSGYYAWAVRSGDVAAAVPEPGIVWLLGVGIAGWLGTRAWRREGVSPVVL